MANVQFTRVQDQRVVSIMSGRDQGAAQVDGSYYVVTSPTPQTGIALTTSITADTQTTPVMLVQNNYAVTDPNAKDILPIRLKLILVAQAPTSASVWQGTLRLDNTPAKYTSGGSVLSTTPGCKNVNPRFGNKSPALVYFGAITGLTSSNDGFLLWNGILNETIPIVKDTIILDFGGAGAATSYENTASVNSKKSCVVPPAVIPPQWWMAFNMFGLSNAAASQWEVVFEYMER